MRDHPDLVPQVSVQNPSTFGNGILQDDILKNDNGSAMWKTWTFCGFSETVLLTNLSSRLLLRGSNAIDHLFNLFLRRTRIWDLPSLSPNMSFETMCTTALRQGSNNSSIVIITLESAFQLSASIIIIHTNYILRKAGIVPCN